MDRQIKFQGNEYSESPLEIPPGRGQPAEKIVMPA